MVERVLYNARHNGLDNVSAVAFDLTQPIAEQPFSQESWDTMIVDPPRSGAKEVLEALPLKNIARVLYVSCNPATLARDARILIDGGFSMTHLGIMDMFPQTAHVESMALFVKRGIEWLRRENFIRFSSTPIFHWKIGLSDLRVKHILSQQKSCRKRSS